MSLVRISASLLGCVLFVVPLLLPLDADAQVPNVGGAGGSCPNPPLTRDLQVPMAGNDVQALQQFLVARGHMTQADFSSGPGIFGPRTKAAVQRFQTANGVPATGYVGPLTRQAIVRVCQGGGGGGTGPQSVSLSASPVNGKAPLTTAFVVIAQGAACGTHILDFGDGKAENLENFCGARTVPHVYAAQGKFNARLDQIVGGQRVQKAQATIEVGAEDVPAPTCTMTLSKNTITRGDSATVNWSSTNATSAKWADGSSVGTSGSAVFTNLATTTVKSITFTGRGGTKQCSVTITVTQPPTGTITATGNAIANGSTVAVSPGGQSAFKLAEFTLAAGAHEAVTLKKFIFTLRNQTTSGTAGAATVANYRVTIGTNSYPVTVTKNGTHDTATVSLGSGVTWSASQSLGVGVFADITPGSGGNLDLWIYPADMEFTGNTSGAAVKPVSNVTNRVDTELLYWSGWVSVGVGGSGSGGGAVPGKCFMDGVESGAQEIPATCSTYGRSYEKPGEEDSQCKQYQSAKPVCTPNGWTNINWGGGYINPSNISVGCTASNAMVSPYTSDSVMYVPGNSKVAANLCTEDNPSQTLCDVRVVCKRDGWWLLDGSGFELRKLDKQPWIYPENFYPNY